MKRKGFTLIELMIVVAIIAIIAAIAVPNLISALSAGAETRAITLLRALASAQAAYQVGHASKFATDLQDLAADGHISTDRATALDGGNEANYDFIYSASGSNYTAYAHPVDNDAGKRSFFINASGTVRWIANKDGSTPTGGESWKVLGNE